MGKQRIRKNNNKLKHIIMESLAQMVIIPSIFYFIYLIFELYARRKERMAIIEKLSEGIDPSIINQLGAKKIRFNIENKSAWTIRIGLLLFGIGLGVVIVALLEAFSSGASIQEYASLDWDKINMINRSPIRQAFNVLYPASAALFGGIGLITAFFVERKFKIKDEQ